MPLPFAPVPQTIIIIFLIIIFYFHYYYFFSLIFEMQGSGRQHHRIPCKAENVKDRFILNTSFDMIFKLSLDSRLKFKATRHRCEVKMQAKRWKGEGSFKNATVAHIRQISITFSLC